MNRKIENYISIILITPHKLGKKSEIPKLRFRDHVEHFIIMDMPRELSKKQIDMILKVTGGFDYKLMIQRGTEKHMMMIEKNCNIDRSSSE